MRFKKQCSSNKAGVATWVIIGDRGIKKMAQSQVIEGTTEEIAALLQTGAFAGQKLRVIVEPDEKETKAIPKNYRSTFGPLLTPAEAELWSDNSLAAP